MPDELPNQLADELRDALDYIAIARLQATYGDVITRQAWDELEALFVPDAPITLDLRTGTPIELIGAAALGSMVATAIERFEYFQFALLNSVVDVVDIGDPSDPEGRTATGRLYMWELRQNVADGKWSNAYGLYRDQYVRHEGRWAIGSRSYSSLARTSTTGARAARAAGADHDSAGAAGADHDYEVFPIPPL